MNKQRKSVYNLVASLLCEAAKQRSSEAAKQRSSEAKQKKSVIVYIKQGNKLVDFITGNNSLELAYLKSCIIYLSSRDLTIKTNTLSKRSKQAKQFHNFFCKYKEKSLSFFFHFV